MSYYGDGTKKQAIYDGIFFAEDKYERDGELWNTRVSGDDYYDREGYPWSRTEFC